MTPVLTHRDGGWAFCGSCGRQRTWSGPVDPGCDCPGDGLAMVVAYEEGDFTIGVDPSVDEDYTATRILDLHTLDTPTAADLLRAARRADQLGAVLVIDGQRAEAMTLAALRAENAASGYRGADAIRDMLAAVPAPIIEEARPMNRKQRRLAARRKR